MTQIRTPSQRQPQWHEDDDLFVSDAQHQHPARRPIPQMSAGHANDVASGQPRSPLASGAPASRQPVARRQPARSTSRAALHSSDRRRAWLWALLGFLVGVAFWHLIGFWGFVAQIVLPPVTEPRSSASANPPNGIDPASSNALLLPARAARPRVTKAPQVAAD